MTDKKGKVMKAMFKWLYGYICSLITPGIVIHEGGFMPTRAHRYDAGMDLYAPRDFTIPARSYDKIDLMISIAIPEYCDGRLCPKSGHMSRGITVMGGEIDCGYTGKVCMCLRNENDHDVHFYRGNKIGQMVIHPVWIGDMKRVDSLEETERGEGGFGSTGD